MAPPSGAAVPPGGGIPQVEPPRFFGDIFPQDHADFSWVPDRMDPNSSYRLAVRGVSNAEAAPLEITSSIVEPPLEITPSLVEPSIQNASEEHWVDDDVEYVGLDDEDPIEDLPILNRQDIEGTAKLKGVIGGYMLHSCKMEGLGSFKAEVEKTNPGSLVDIEYEQVVKKMRFTRIRDSEERSSRNTYGQLVELFKVIGSKSTTT
ncbi:hypothetical protein E2562_004380 [Oryza meyeriana var. granulata]|uniref:Uncharacterized protein n=1 Tax=Oryza meyeriana var. granulata TaxID=110450 RepID=A0A6G1D0Y1_9ORYZ|nr:hypothetical protein E2562_004380 [Oryza meyeriana var. granulata]